MPGKKTFKEVKRYIKELNGILLSPSYINQETPLRLQCPQCNKIFEKNLRMLTRIKSPLCPQCLKNNKVQSQKFSKEKLLEMVELRGFKFLDDYSDYINQKTLLNLECINCGKVVKKSRSSLRNKRNKFCNSCSYKESNGRRRLSFEDIEKYIKKTEVELIDVNFSKYPPEVTLKCSCSDIFKVKSKDFKNFMYNVTHQLCPKCVNQKCHCGTSNVEFEVLEYLNSFVEDEIIKGDRKLLKGFELDFYIPTRNLGIEIDGVYWHSEIEGKKDNRYHLNKTIQCNKEGVKLLHFFDREWNEKGDIVKSMISSNLNNTKRIYARKCIVKTINAKAANDFYIDNHIQGSINSSIHYALFYNDKIVSVMSFSKSRFNKECVYELTRFCSLLYTTVVGGASKLLKSFLRDFNHPSIVSYADRRYSEGNVYDVLGFQKVKINKPNYSYLYNGKMYSRLKFQKKKQKKIFTNFNPDLTEWENMLQNGFDRIWNCGTITYTLNM